MITVSNEYRRLIHDDKRKFIVTVEMRLADGTQLTIGNDKIMSDGIQFDDAVGEDNSFSAVGSAIINTFTLVLNNIYDDFSEYDFTDAKITKILLGLELSDGTIETLKKAYVNDSLSQDREIYTVDEPSYNGATITLTCLDNMSKFDRPYSETNLIYPTRLDNIIIDACQKCGVTLAANSITFPNYNFEVTERPAQATTSFREVISWVATIAGCFARCNTSGELELKWFDTDTLEQDTGTDGGIFDGGVENFVKPSMRIGDKFQSNGLTVEYISNGWWHVYGEREDNSAIRFDLYEDVLDETSGSYTFRLETKSFTTSQEPKIGYLCYPQEGQLVSWSSSASPYTTNVYSLPILGLAFWQRTGSALPAYDGFVRFSVAKTIQEPYQSGDTADGGIFSPWNIGDVIDGGNLADNTILNIYGLYSQDIGTDDVVITKVSARIRSNDTPADERITSADGIISYSTGTDGYEILVENNQFITASNIITVVNYLGDQLIGLRFRKLNVSHLSDPTIEAGDIARVWDRKSNRYPILVTRTSFSIGGSQTTVCGASTPLRNSAGRFSEVTKSYVDLRKQIQEVKNPYAKALSDLAEAMQQPGGMYETKITQPDGSVITFKHNMPDLAQSDKQIAITDVGMTFTTNGTDEHPTWYGHTVDGRIVASVLDAAGINAEWIRTGQLIVLDTNGNETFFADYVTGEVRINATHFNVMVGSEAKSIEDIASEATGALRTEINQTLTEVEVTVSQTSEDFDELKMHYRFDAEGETIGKSDSDKSIRLANDGIDMMVNEESVTKWNQNEMYTPVKVMVPVGGSLQLGDFVFQPRTNGNMSLFYVGED